MKWVIICLAVGFTSSFFTISSIPAWYATLTKPWFNPPNWLFGPVWTVLYILMGVAAALIKKPNKFFVTQLVLNFFWSFIFFYLKLPLAAFIEIIFLWIFIVLTIRDFRRRNKTAAYLLIPYLMWVTFASLLNLSIVILNP